MCLEILNNQQLTLKLWINPSAKKSEIVGLYGEPPRLRVRIAAPPREGAANDEILKFFSKLFSIPKASLALIKGLESKQKTLLIDGIEFEACLRALGLRPKQLSLID